MITRKWITANLLPPPLLCSDTCLFPARAWGGIYMLSNNKDASLCFSFQSPFGIINKRNLCPLHKAKCNKQLWAPSKSRSDSDKGRYTSGWVTAPSWLTLQSTGNQRQRRISDAQFRANSCRARHYATYLPSDCGQGVMVTSQNSPISLCRLLR